MIGYEAIHLIVVVADFVFVFCFFFQKREEISSHSKHIIIGNLKMFAKSARNHRVEVSFHRAVALELETSLKIGLRHICFLINLRNFSGKVFWRILVP